MTNLEWLLKGDSTIVYLTHKYLLKNPIEQKNEGFIKQYLDLFDRQTLTWGQGYYSPKWVSTHYTLYDLRYLEIDPTHEIYQTSLTNYVSYFFKHYQYDLNITKHDLCIAGMMIDMLSYGRIEHEFFYLMVDYIIDHKMPDGGWNCRYNHRPFPKISSVHTTINVLEGLATYINQGYTYRINEVKKCLHSGIKVLLSRDLIYKKESFVPVHKDMVKHHFPYRWKYDYLRVLELLAKLEYDYVDEIKPALKVLKNALNKGKLNKGSKIPGRTHFSIEEGTFGRFNTLRAYIVLKHFEPALYEDFIKMTY